LLKKLNSEGFLDKFTCRKGDLSFSLSRKLVIDKFFSLYFLSYEFKGVLFKLNSFLDEYSLLILFKFLFKVLLFELKFDLLNTGLFIVLLVVL
jgi:hypothetical protein